MSDPKEQTPYYEQSKHGRGKSDDCDPKPPPCPDPCAKDPEWGPPHIRPECCPDDRDCCPKGHPGCAWDDVEDPCVRASSCVESYTKIDCKCESSNEECKCKEWECGSYPYGACVPCTPCEGLLPEGDGPTGGCDEPPPGDCNAADLRTKLDALKRCISSQEGEKARIEADIKARQEREKELAALVESFEKILGKYKDERQKLIFSEECFKGFYREMTTNIFTDEKRFPSKCLKGMRDAINADLCLLEREKCCQKNLEEKLSKVTKLIWEQQKAEKSLKKAEDEYKLIQDLAKWIGDQFKDLDDLKAQIIAALNDLDPEKQKWAFYLFYWKFAPKLCRRFPVAICCDKGKPPAESCEDGSTQPPPDHLGCEPADWHPSVITVEKLTKLICCAFDNVRKNKQSAQEANSKVEDTKRNLEFIKKQVEADAKGLEDRIKSDLKKVTCESASGSNSSSK